MSIRRRLARLEKAAAEVRRIAGPDTEAREYWGAFYAWLQAVVEPYPDALANLRARVGANLCTWESQAKPGVKLWVLTETAWEALGEFPEALRATRAAWDALLASNPHTPSVKDAVAVLNQSRPTDPPAAETPVGPLPDVADVVAAEVTGPAPAVEVAARVECDEW
jgi:hypothetical protein